MLVDSEAVFIVELDSVFSVLLLLNDSTDDELATVVLFFSLLIDDATDELFSVFFATLLLDAIVLFFIDELFSVFFVALLLDAIVLFFIDELFSVFFATLLLDAFLLETLLLATADDFLLNAFLLLATTDDFLLDVLLELFTKLDLAIPPRCFLLVADLAELLIELDSLLEVFFDEAFLLDDLTIELFLLDAFLLELFTELLIELDFLLKVFFDEAFLLDDLIIELFLLDAFLLELFDFFDQQCARVARLLSLYDGWGMTDARVLGVLGAAYARYLLSGLERTLDPRAHMDAAARRDFLRAALAGDPGRRVLPLAAPQGRAARLTCRVLQGGSPAACYALARAARFARTRLPALFTRLRQSR